MTSVLFELWLTTKQRKLHISNLSIKMHTYGKIQHFIKENQRDVLQEFIFYMGIIGINDLFLFRGVPKLQP